MSKAADEELLYREFLTVRIVCFDSLLSEIAVANDQSPHSYLTGARYNR
jgi:hypothetical protein